MIRISQQHRGSVGTTLFVWSSMIVAITAGEAAADELFTQLVKSNWTRIESWVTTSAPQELEAADRVWASGSDTDAGGQHVLMLHFDGASWTQFASPAGDLAILRGNWGRISRSIELKGQQQ